MVNTCLISLELIGPIIIVSTVNKEFHFVLPRIPAEKWNAVTVRQTALLPIQNQQRHHQIVLLSVHPPTAHQYNVEIKQLHSPEIDGFALIVYLLRKASAIRPVVKTVKPKDYKGDAEISTLIILLLEESM